MLVRYGFDPQNHIKINAGLGEAVVADERLKSLDPAGGRLQHLFGDLDRDLLHLVQIAAIADAHGNDDRTFGVRLRVVGEDGLGDLLVRHDHHAVVGVLDGRVAPVHVDDLAIFAGRQFHEIPHLDLLGHQNIDAGKQIRQGVLQRQSDGQAADAQSGEQRRDRDPERLQQKQEADGVHDQVDDGRQDRGGGERPVGFLELLLQIAGAEAGDHEGHGQNGQGIAQPFQEQQRPRRDRH